MDFTKETVSLIKINCKTTKKFIFTYPLMVVPSVQRNQIKGMTFSLHLTDFKDTLC